MEAIFEIFIINKLSLGTSEVPHEILGSFGFAVLTFIGYKIKKQTDTQTNRQAKYIYRYTHLKVDHSVKCIIGYINSSLSKNIFFFVVKLIHFRLINRFFLSYFWVSECQVFIPVPLNWSFVLVCVKSVKYERWRRAAGILWKG